MMKVVHAANLDKLVENFTVLEQKIAETQGRTNLLDIQLEESKRLLKLAQTKESCMKEECTMLHRMIEGLQSTIQNQCDVRDENEQLKKWIQVLEQKIQMAEEEKKSRIEMLVTEIKTMEQKHKVELAEIQQDMSRKFEIKETEINGIIDKKQAEILELNRQLRFQEREKQSEIIKLQMEFNSKLVRIQSTLVKSTHQDSSALPQNIFKRKLIYLQEEKNREISALRQNIQELEQQLSVNQDNRLKRRRV